MLQMLIAGATIASRNPDSRGIQGTYMYGYTDIIVELNESQSGGIMHHFIFARSYIKSQMIKSCACDVERGAVT